VDHVVPVEVLKAFNQFRACFQNDVILVFDFNLPSNFCVDAEIVLSAELFHSPAQFAFEVSTYIL
jgi:hypothetical protein